MLCADCYINHEMPLPLTSPHAGSCAPMGKPTGVDAILLARGSYVAYGALRAPMLCAPMGALRAPMLYYSRDATPLTSLTAPYGRLCYALPWAPYGYTTREMPHLSLRLRRPAGADAAMRSRGRPMGSDAILLVRGCCRGLSLRRTTPVGHPIGADAIPLGRRCYALPWAPYGRRCYINRKMPLPLTSFTAPY